MSDEDDANFELYVDKLSTLKKQQSNATFQLALIVLRIATEPVSEAYRDEVSQSLLSLIRKKPKSSVTRLFGHARPTEERSRLGSR